ncbi:MAG TPA: phosphopantothenate/pantothenate synthetase, partial [Thermoplasmata archaeon]|nr:phosphopantothenate/pantothenate synthetase [Thermoplasmata archaeon]
IVAPQGLIAHGRGEAMYYLLGERTTKEARIAARAAAAALLRSERPVISVNGNVAALASREVVDLAKTVGARIEISLFHRSDARVSKIQAVLESDGATDILGFLPDERIPGLDGVRGRCSSEGVYSADVVLVALEDGDRTEALTRMGKKVVAIDLNPMSRTARAADVSVVDEVTRAIPLISGYVEEMSGDEDALDNALAKYDREANLRAVMKMIAINLGLGD